MGFFKRRGRQFEIPDAPPRCQPYQWLTTGTALDTPWGPISLYDGFLDLGGRCWRCGIRRPTVSVWYRRGSGQGVICEPCWDELATAERRLPWFYAIWFYNLINHGYIEKSRWPEMLTDALDKWPLLETAVREERTEANWYYRNDDEQARP